MVNWTRDGNRTLLCKDWVSEVQTEDGGVGRLTKVRSSTRQGQDVRECQRLGLSDTCG